MVRLKKLVTLLMSYYPTRLPLGMTEFDNWAKTIISLLGPGLENVPENDIKFVLSTTLQRLDPDEHRRPMQYFVRVIRSAGVKQVAAQVFQDIKTKQAEELAKKQAAATAQQEAVANEKTEEKTQ